MKKFLLGVLIMMAATATASALAAEPLKLIVPGAIGSATDIAARQVSKSLAAHGVLNVVLNKPGAGGVVGAAFAQDEKHSLFVTSSAALIISPLTIKDLPYDPAKFEPIFNIGYVPNALVVNKNMPVANMDEFIAYVRANPGKVRIGVPTARTAPHIAWLATVKVLNLDVITVPYTGKPAAFGLTDVLGGHIEGFFGDVRDQTAPELLTLVRTHTRPHLTKYGVPGGSGWLVLAANQHITDEQKVRFNLMLDTDIEMTSHSPYHAAGGDLAIAQRHFMMEVSAWKRLVDLAGIVPE